MMKKISLEVEYEDEEINQTDLMKVLEYGIHKYVLESIMNIKKVEQ